MQGGRQVSGQAESGGGRIVGIRRGRQASFGGCCTLPSRPPGCPCCPHTDRLQTAQRTRALWRHHIISQRTHPPTLVQGWRMATSVAHSVALSCTDRCGWHQRSTSAHRDGQQRAQRWRGPGGGMRGRPAPPATPPALPACSILLHPTLLALPNPAMHTTHYTPYATHHALHTVACEASGPTRPHPPTSVQSV